MRRFAAGVVLAALLMLFVAVVTRTTEKRAEGRETTMAFVVTVECPCVGECEAHARMASDLETQYAEAEGHVLKLPLRYVVSHRSDIQVNDQVVVNSRLISVHGYDTFIDYGLRSGRTSSYSLRPRCVLILPHRGGCLNVNDTHGIHGIVNTYDTSAASVSVRTGRFSAGVL